ncbi:MAG: glycosyltransferase [Candidatus Omnitrophica bacterium]|nr:glycosyltransferase [Candidatus Omnitrophota bacterium]
MGDLISSLDLGRELRKLNKNIFFLVNKDKIASNFIRNNGFPVKEIDSLSDLGLFLKEKFFDISILNQLNTESREVILFKKHSRRLVTIEDVGKSSLLADLRFNILYPQPKAITELSFLPLSKVFQEKHTLLKQIKKKAKNILVLQGGSDTYGFTPKIIKSLNSVDPQIKINVVLGPYFSHFKELDIVLRNSSREFDIISNCSDLSFLMTEADIAISAAGNTLFELACLGVPTMVVCAEKFEEITAKILEEKGFCINLGYGSDIKEKDIFATLDRLTANYKLRFSMSKRGKELIDGAGIKRIVNRIEKLIDSIDNNEKRGKQNA